MKSTANNLTGILFYVNTLQLKPIHPNSRRLLSFVSKNDSVIKNENIKIDHLFPQGKFSRSS